MTTRLEHSISTHHYDILTTLIACQDLWDVEPLAISKEKQKAITDLANEIFLTKYLYEFNPDAIHEKKLVDGIPFWIKRNIYFFTEEKEKQALEEVCQIFKKTFPHKTAGIEMLNHQQAVLEEAAHHTITYEEMTRFYPEAEAVIAERAASPEKITHLCERLAEDDWMTVMQEYREDIDGLAYDGLRAFRDRQIDYYTFFTLTLFWSFTSEYQGTEVTVCQLFDDQKNRDPEIYEAFKKMLQKTQLDIEQAFHVMDGVDLFFELMKKQHPNSGHAFLVFKKIEGPKGDRPNIVDVITHSVKMHTFMEIELNGELYSMIPSAHMMQTWLQAMQACHNGDAVWTDHVIGESPIEEIKRNGLTGKRVMGHRFPKKPLPNTADTYSLKLSVEFSLHDWYHNCIVSGLSDAIRKKIIHVGELIEQLENQETDLKLKHFIKCFAFRMIDMEHIAFREPAFNPYTNIPKTLSTIEKFILSIYSTFLFSLTETNYEEMSNPMENPASEKIPPIILGDYEFTMRWKERDLYYKALPLMQRLAEQLIEDGFFEEYGEVTTQDIENSKQFCRETIERWLQEHVNTLEKVLFDNDDDDEGPSVEQQKADWVKRELAFLDAYSLPNLLDRQLSHSSQVAQKSSAVVEAAYESTSSS